MRISAHAHMKRTGVSHRDVTDQLEHVAERQAERGDARTEACAVLRVELVPVQTPPPPQPPGTTNINPTNARSRARGEIVKDLGLWWCQPTLRRRCQTTASARSTATSARGWSRGRAAACLTCTQYGSHRTCVHTRINHQPARACPLVCPRSGARMVMSVRVFTRGTRMVMVFTRAVGVVMLLRTPASAS